MISFNFITARLATGGAIGSLADVQALVDAGVNVIVNCCEDDDAQWLTPLDHWHYLHNPQPDDWKPKPVSWFKATLEFVLPFLAKPGFKAYIHCHDGIDRGPSNTAAVLMALGFSREAALAMIRLHRPIALAKYAGDAEAAVKQLGYV